MRTNRSMPKATVIPTLAYRDVVEAADWLCRAFGFTVRLRIADHRIQLNVGDGAIVVTELREGGVADHAHAVMVRVASADSHYEKAKGAGAKSSNRLRHKSTASANTPSKTRAATAGPSPNPSPTSSRKTGAARRCRSSPTRTRS